jgi:hypothetical protein
MKIFDYFKTKQLLAPDSAVTGRAKWLLMGLGGFIVLLLVFQLGMFVGYRKANFTFRWGDNYHRMFGGPQGGFMRDFAGRDFTSGHGVAGQVVQVEDGLLIIKGSDEIEKIVTVKPETIIRRGRQTIKLSDLKIDDRLVVIGVPQDDGSIEARIIRLFDSTDLSPRPPFGFDRPDRF